MRLFQHILRLVFVSGCAIQVLGQTDPCLDRTVPVNVYTERGEAFTPLTAFSFQPRMGGKPVSVTSVTLDTGPRRILILIDVSGSMTEEDRLKWGLEFTRDLISLTPLRDSLALVTFSTRTEDVVAFGQSPDALLAEVYKLQGTDWRRVKSARKTALVDALADALAMMKSPRVGDAICLVSDGGENASQSNWSRVKALFESSGIRVYVFLPTPTMSYRASSPEESVGLPGLYDLTSATGGDLLAFEVGMGTNERQRKITRLAAEGISKEISSIVKLTVRLPDPLAEPRSWKLEVVDASGRRIKHLQLFYPQRLGACAPGDNP